MFNKFTSLLFSIFVTVAVLISCSKSDSSTNTDPCAGKSITISATVGYASTPTSANGSLTVTAVGSTGFTYSLGTGAYQSSGTFTGLIVGSYSVNAKDAAGCVKSQSFAVTVAPCPTINVTGTTTQATNATTANGSITATASGSTGFMYKLNSGIYQASGIFSNLVIGTYTVTAKDVNGCTGLHAFTVTTATCPTINVSAVTTQTSSTSNTGTVTVTTTGGASPYQYAINGTAFQSSNLFTNMPAGGFTVAVMDVNGCPGSTSGTITVATPTTVTINIASFAYNPSPQTVAVGTIVKWHNSDGAVHTATSDTGVFDTGNISGGATSSGYTANTAGTFPYHCLIHGTSMAGVLIVN